MGAGDPGQIEQLSQTSGKSGTSHVGGKRGPGMVDSNPWTQANNPGTAAWGPANAGGQASSSNKG